MIFHYFFLLFYGEKGFLIPLLFLGLFMLMNYLELKSRLSFLRWMENQTLTFDFHYRSKSIGNYCSVREIVVHAVLVKKKKNEKKETNRKKNPLAD